MPRNMHIESHAHKHTHTLGNTNTRHTDYRDINRHKETQTHTSPCVRTHIQAQTHTCTFPKLPFKVEGTVVPGPRMVSGSFYTTSKLGEEPSPAPFAPPPLTATDLNPTWVTHSGSPVGL